MDERNEFGGMPPVDSGNDDSPFDEISQNPEQNDIPDPAADPSTYQSSAVSLSKPAPASAAPELQNVSQPTSQAFGETVSGEYTFAQDPHVQQAAPQNAYAQSAGSYGQPAPAPAPMQQNAYDYGNAYNQQPASQNPYNQQNFGGGMNQPGSPELEQRARTVMTLGIVGLIVSVVIGCCCCTIPGPVIGIIGLVKANGLKPMMSSLSPEAQQKVNTGKILCIIAIVISAVSALIGAISGFTGSLESLLSESDYYY